VGFNFNGLGLIVYVLQAWALYTIAQRRGIQKPWLAWIPVVNVWILGSISDQYQYVVKKQIKSKRKVLLGLNIAMAAIVAVLIIALVWFVISLVMVGVSMELFSSGNMPDGNVDPMVLDVLSDEIGVLLLLCLLSLPLLVLSIVHTVFFYMAVYDVFRSCEPSNSTLYLVLSLVGNVVVDGACCIFLILCKDKDLGMPPRKPEIADEIPENTEE
jgi:hypothetical protein